MTANELTRRRTEFGAPPGEPFVVEARRLKPSVTSA
jgi:hypothetical protein